MDIKENFAENLIKYRKALGLTQAQLSEKINYSDKAVSKWERAESLPDLEVVKILADLFNVKIDDLISEEKKEIRPFFKQTATLRTIIYLSATAFVWLLAICCYAFLNIIIPSISDYWPTWLALIYALPITAIVIYVFTSVWKRKILNLIFSSIFFWTLALSIYLSLITMLPSPPTQLWEIFLIPIPIQALLLFMFFYKKVK